jgi:hypothetical protein
MRNLSTTAFAVAFGTALLSISFLAITTRGGALANQVCNLGGSFCARPWLLLIPITVTLAWALMLKTIPR